ncbi:MAG: integration host factor subunit beta [Gammaproteobacteria bacterium]|nr:MAG: integration host factor subunit beta [Gammaproteobacteria bacterium]
MSGDDTTGDSRARAARSLTKSDVIDELARHQDHLPHRDVEQAVKLLLEKMSQELAYGDRIEVRGFGSFSLHFRPARMGRNPKSGDAVALRGKHVPHFKPGKELRERVNRSGGYPSQAESMEE